MVDILRMVMISYLSSLRRKKPIKKTIATEKRKILNIKTSFGHQLPFFRDPICQFFQVFRFKHLPYCISYGFPVMVQRTGRVIAT